MKNSIEVLPALFCTRTLQRVAVLLGVCLVLFLRPASAVEEEKRQEGAPSSVRNLDVPSEQLESKKEIERKKTSIKSSVEASKKKKVSVNPERVISIGGGLTEIVYRLGRSKMLVGSDTTSYFPAAAKELPKVGYLRALSAEGILSLKPDLVLMDSESGPDSVLHQLSAAGVKSIHLSPARSIEDILLQVRKIAKSLGAVEAGEALTRQIQAETEDLTRRIEQAGRHPRVLLLLNHGNGMAMVAGKNTAGNSMITLSGGKNVVEGFSGYKTLTPESLLGYNPEIILAANINSSKEEEKRILFLPGLALTDAGRHKRIITMDPLLLLGFGPRTSQAALTLFEAYQNPLKQGLERQMSETQITK